MTNKIDRDKLVEHARRLDSEVRQWTDRQLRSTYSYEHLSGKPRTTEEVTPSQPQGPTTEPRKSS